MSKTVLEIQDLARDVRKKFELGLIPKEILVKLYSEYNPKVEAVTFVNEAETIFPSLNCGLTSVYLQEVLGGKIVHGKYGNQNHTFLKYQDTIVDITADQFGGPKVYVGKLKSPWKGANESVYLGGQSTIL